MGIIVVILKALGMHRLETYVRVLVMTGAASGKILVSTPSRSRVPDCFKCWRAL